LAPLWKIRNKGNTIVRGADENLNPNIPIPLATYKPRSLQSISYMEKCRACIWHCDEERKCKKAPGRVEIDPELLEDVEFRMPDLYVGI